MSRTRDLRQVIEDEIVEGHLALGARLDEAQLAARFGVSRTPIREALLQLAVSGLVETKPRRGTLVSAPEPHHLLAMFETMAEIEATCGRLAARRLTPADGKALEAALTACAAASADCEAYYAENYVFHGLIYRRPTTASWRTRRSPCTAASRPTGACNSGCASGCRSRWPSTRASWRPSSPETRPPPRTGCASTSWCRATASRTSSPG